MLDIIKYSPLEFRKHEGQCIPRGPSFERAQTEEVLLPQCTLEFRAPRHAPLRKHGTEQHMVVPGKHYDLSNAASYTKRWMPSGGWERTQICSRTWAFYGPWFTGYMGKVGFSLNAEGTTAANPDINFLYPSAFETAVQGYMTARWGGRIYDEARLAPRYTAPRNWTSLKNFPVPAVQFDLDEKFTYGDRRCYVFFPVSRDKLISIYFRYGQSCTGKWEDQDAKISPQPMRDLIDNIIASIRLTPSPELQAEIDQAKGACGGDYAVSSECQPFKWPADVDKDGLTILEYRKDRYPRS